MLLWSRSTFTGRAIGVCRSFEIELAQRFLEVKDQVDDLFPAPKHAGDPRVCARARLSLSANYGWEIIICNAPWTQLQG